jgi:hypothetical protein
MNSVVRPELSTAAAGPAPAPAAAGDNSAPVATHPEPTYKSGKAVQTTGTTSMRARARLTDAEREGYLAHSPNIGSQNLQETGKGIPLMIT